MADRAKKLVWNGQLNALGEPREYFSFVPPRDLNEAEIAALDDDQYDEITGAAPGKAPLYLDPAHPVVDPLDGMSKADLESVALNLNLRVPKDVKTKDELHKFVALERKRIEADLTATTEAVKAAGLAAPDTLPVEVAPEAPVTPESPSEKKVSNAGDKQAKP